MYSGTLPRAGGSCNCEPEPEGDRDQASLQRLGLGMLSLRRLGVSVLDNDDDPGSLGPPPALPAAPY
jgi:hypothetical protein